MAKLLDMALAWQAVPKARQGWMTLADVAWYFSISERYVKRLTKEKGLRYRRVGRQLWFKREWLDEWLERQPGSER